MNNEEIVTKLQEHGFTILEERYSKKKIPVVDRKGYKYVIDLYNIICLNQNVLSFHVSNPYTIENIQTYLNNFNPTSFIQSTEYKGNEDTLIFKCGLCGRLYQRSWAKMKSCKNKVCRKCISHVEQSYSRDYIEGTFERHGYKLLEEKYIRNSQPLLCEDKDGYKYKISLQNLEKGRNPRKFSMEYNMDNYSDNLNLFIKKNKLNIKLIELLPNNKAKFECSCGDLFTTDVYRVVSGEKRRCNKCTHKISGLELEVMNYLSFKNIRFDYQHVYNDCRNKKCLPFDFYLPDFNTCIEIDGDQHFHPAFTSNTEKALKNFKKILSNDEKKERYCKKNNINLIRIPYWEIKNGKFKKILSQFTNRLNNELTK